MLRWILENRKTVLVLGPGFCTEQGSAMGVKDEVCACCLQWSHSYPARLLQTLKRIQVSAFCTCAYLIRPQRPQKSHFLSPVSTSHRTHHIEMTFCDHKHRKEDTELISLSNNTQPTAAGNQTRRVQWSPARSIKFWSIHISTQQPEAAQRRFMLTNSIFFCEEVQQLCCLTWH